MPTFVRERVMEYDLEWRVFKGGAVDVASDPVVIEYRMSL